MAKVLMNKSKNYIAQAQSNKHRSYYAQPGKRAKYFYASPCENNETIDEKSRRQKEQNHYYYAENFMRNWML